MRSDSCKGMRVLGIDPGTRHMGVAVVQVPDILLFHAVLRSDGPISVWTRIANLWLALDDICQKYQPEHIAIEEFTYFPKSFNLIQLQSMNGMIGAIATLQRHLPADDAERFHIVHPHVWQRQVLGVSKTFQITKEQHGIILGKRLGVSFVRGGPLGGLHHDADATGVALYVQDTLLASLAGQQAHVTKARKRKQ